MRRFNRVITPPIEYDDLPAGVSKSTMTITIGSFIQRSSTSLHQYPGECGREQFAIRESGYPCLSVSLILQEAENLMNRILLACIVNRQMEDDPCASFLLSSCLGCHAYLSLLQLFQSVEGAADDVDRTVLLHEFFGFQNRRKVRRLII